MSGSNTATGQAVSKKDILIVNILLANSVKCGRPRSLHSSTPWGVEDWGISNTMEGIFELEMYTPPLVRAVDLGDLDLVRFGAKLNVGCHGFYTDGDPYRFNDFHMSCGRPIQLAKELADQDVVEVLFDHGANIDLAQPDWRHDDCKMIPREACHQIITQLRAAAAMRGC
jgi:hypothetical protein